MNYALLTARELEILRTFHGAFLDANQLLSKEGGNMLTFKLVNVDEETICENCEDEDEIIFYTRFKEDK